MVTRRFAELSMCLEWGVLPAVYDRLPEHRRIEMMKWWSWRNEREGAITRLRTLNSKYFGKR